MGVFIKGSRADRFNAVRLKNSRGSVLARHRQQHNAVVRADAPIIESGCDFLADNCWKRERQEVTVSHGGRGWREMANRIGVNNCILR